MEVKITSKAGTTIEIINELPDELKKFKMPLSDIQSAVCKFGTMCFQKIKGHEWEAWRSRYIIHEDAELEARAEIPIIELHTARRDHFRYDWEGIPAPAEKALQFNLSYSPHIKNKVWLVGGKVYDSMDFHLSRNMLAEYAEVYPELGEFLNKVDQKKPASLAGTCTLTKKMQSLLADMEEFDCKPGIYIKNMKARLEIFLTEALEVLCTKKPAKKTIITSDLRQKAKQAAKILRERLEDPPSIAELARLCTTNSFSLQAAFKEVFSMNIDDYSKEARIEHAKHLLINTKWDLDSIADDTGYYDGSSLSRYFKRHVGCTPGDFRRFGRKRE
jgi:AraC-like DNA-binding protein